MSTINENRRTKRHAGFLVGIAVLLLALVSGHLQLKTDPVLSSVVSDRGSWSTEVLSHSTDIVMTMQEALRGEREHSGTAVYGGDLASLLSGHRPPDESNPQGYFKSKDGFLSSFLRDRNGQFSYVSFPPFGFWAVALGLEAVGATADAWSMSLVGAMLNFLSALGVAAVVWVVQGGSRLYLRGIASVVGAAAYLFLPEVLHAPATLWAHHIAMPVYLALLCAAISGDGTRRSLLVLAGLSCLGGLIEWSGYLFAAAIAAAFWISSERRSAVAVIAGAVVAGLMTVGVFVWSFGFEAWFQAIIARIGANSGGGRLRTYGQLFGLYARSFWTVAMAIPTMLIILRFLGKDPLGALIGRIRRRDKGALVLACFSVAALGENLILKDHAVVYTFATLKIAAVLSIAFALLLVRIIPHLGRLGHLYAVVGVAGLAILSVFEWRMTFALPGTVQQPGEIAAVRSDIDAVASPTDFLVLDASFEHVNWVPFSLKDAEVATLLGRRAVIASSACAGLDVAREAGIEPDGIVFVRGGLISRSGLKPGAPRRVMDAETWQSEARGSEDGLLVKVISTERRLPADCPRRQD